MLFLLKIDEKIKSKRKLCFLNVLSACPEGLFLSYGSKFV